MNKEIEKLLTKLKTDKRILIITLLGIVGITLLTLSEIFPQKETHEKTSEESSSTQAVEEYEKNLEKRLTELISVINGAGKVQVMLTLDCGDENIYATQDKASEKSSEKDYILIDSGGNDTGLLLKVAQPEVRGVAVVCEGADLPTVRQEITGVLTAVLGISTNRVNIAKMKPDNGG